jgi:hypothetical protein|tara:strand:- start:932 stop:1435 length:504 start_codon:yes stop_codon:yes gene_type:complete
MINNKILLTIGALLIVIGFFQPELNLPMIGGGNCIDTINCVIDAPSNPSLLEKSRVITEIMKKSTDSTRASDCKKLSSLYCDMATLIELDDEDKVIKDTAAIRSANSLAGKMLRLNIKDKYEGLAEAAKELLSESIGIEDAVLTKELRQQAAESFRALSWAFYEGSK